MKKLVLALILLMPSIAFAQSSILFESETHDFGVVDQKGQLEHTFEFRNIGTSDLLITRLSPT